MRRMVTKSGIIDAVNEGIESGEIEVGSGLPEFSDADTGRVLTVVEDAETGDPVASWQDAASGGGEGFTPVGSDKNLYSIGDHKASSVSKISSGAQYGGLIVDGSSSTNTNTEYKCTGSSSVMNGNICMAAWEGQKYIPNGTHLIYNVNIGSGLTAGFADNPAANSIYLGSITNNYTIGYSLYPVNSLILGGQLYKTTYQGSPGEVKNTIVMDDWTNLGYIYGQGDVKNSILLSPFYTVEGQNTNIGGIRSSVIAGSEHTLKKNFSSPTYIDAITLLGRGHYLSYAYDNAGLCMVGKYGISNDGNKDKFIVGAGSSTSARANCFTTGNDGTEDYIKIGETKVTESQLQALLALLNQ